MKRATTSINFAQNIPKHSTISEPTNATNATSADMNASENEDGGDGPSIIPSGAKATNGMRQSLSQLQQLLTCPLCKKMFKKPTTLSSCAHSFCVECIDDHCRDAWVCPVEGCGMPMSVVGGHKGSYRKINPQLLQICSSFEQICHALGQSPDSWWKPDNMVPATR
uniref:RING-type domain-containing protein n=1 Tax=Craspedostauros australis TaxID=1486917 RepID=A0A7R9ZQJ2_9STRA